MLRDGSNELVEIDVKMFGFDDQLFQVVSKQRGPLRLRRERQFRDDRAKPWPDFEESLTSELDDYLVRRVRVDFQGLAQRPDGWEQVSGAELPADDRFLGSVDSLLVNR
jgi:hypothetical protein